MMHLCIIQYTYWTHRITHFNKTALQIIRECETAETAGKEGYRVHNFYLYPNTCPDLTPVDYRNWGIRRERMFAVQRSETLENSREQIINS